MTEYTSVMKLIYSFLSTLVLCGGLEITAQQSAPVSLAESARQLMAAKVEEMDTNVSPETRAALRSFKDGLEREALAVVAAGGKTPEPVRLTKILKRRMQQSGIIFPEKNAENPDGYGFVREAAYMRLPTRPDWMSMVVSFSIPCGDDSILILFHRITTGWQPALRVRADDYEQISGALGSFSYQISPSDSSGKFFVVTTTISPWCQSNWQLLHFQAIRPGPDPEHAALLYKGESGIYLGVDNVLYLNAGREGFKIKFYDYQPLNLGQLIRKRVFTIAIADDHGRRIGPIAESPASFLAEWLTLDWNDAAYWVKPELREALHFWHDAMRNSIKTNKEGEEVDELDAMRRCPDRRLIISLTGRRGLSYLKLTPLGEEGFRITSLGTKDDASCVSEIPLEDYDWKNNRDIPLGK